jgi:hypothetical protein
VYAPGLKYEKWDHGRKQLQGGSMSIQALVSAQGKPVASTSAAPTKHAEKPTAENQKTPPAKPPTKTADTVQISSAGQSALQEATETAAQTAKEARSGDRQAIKLQIKEEAAKTPPTPNESAQKPESLLK